MQVIDVIYLMFTFLSLYFTILFLIIYFDTRKEFLSSPLPKKYESLTVIIPVHNEQSSVYEAIMRIKQSKYPKNKLNILVVDDASTDNTPNILKTIKGITIITNKQNMGCAAKPCNLALKNVKTKYVAIVDADSFIEDTALARMMAILQEDNLVGAVTASITAKNQKTFLQKIQNIEYSIIVWARKLLQSVESIYVTPGPLAMYRTKVLKDVGGFDEKNITQDIEIAWKVMYHGYKVRMSMQSKVKVTSPQYLRAWWRQRLRWSMGGLQTLWKYRHTLFRTKYGMLGQFVGPFFLLSILTSLTGFCIFMYATVITVLKATLAFLAPNQVLQFYIDTIALPSLFLYFGVIIFILSLLYVYLGLHTMDNMKYLSLRRFRVIYIIIYLTAYVTIFPIVLLAAMWRLYRKDMSWY
jgi:poly-beta-1,6-N-acetyl-D-glucosamine synthase